MEPNIIKIRIKDGMIIQIEDIPLNVMIKVYDYDCESEPREFLSRDEDKKQCYIYCYDSDDCIKENI